MGSAHSESFILDARNTLSPLLMWKLSGRETEPTGVPEAGGWAG